MITSLASVHATGGFGAKPKVTGPFPFEINKTQSQVLVQGHGVTVGKSSLVTFNYYLVNATTGKQLETSFGTSPAPTAPANGLIAGFTRSIVGRKAGSRILMVIKSTDGYDSAGGSGDTIKKGDTLVFVVDILGASLSGPEGTTVTPPASLPRVGKDSKGHPTLTIDTKATPPSKLTVQPLIQGKGAAVKATDTILVNYRQYDWASGKLLASDFEGEPESGLLSDVLVAWQKGLLGQKVGSRLMIIAPPSTAYPNGRATPSISAGATLAFVVDILYAYQAATS